MFFKVNNRNTLTASRVNLEHTYAQVFLAFIVSLGILFWQMNGLWHEVPYADEVTYMSVALPLAETGVYKDGTFTETNGLVGENGEGMFFAPLYPAFLAALAKFDNGLFQTMECSVEHRRPVIIEKECAPLQLKTLVLVQIILMAMAATFAWITAFIVTGHLGVSWLALLFIFPGKDYAELAAISMSESVLLPLFALASLVSILAWRKRTYKWVALLGVLYGLLVLTKPSFIYLVLCAIPFLLILGAYEFYKKRSSHSLKLVVVFVLLYAAIVGPWVLRNGNKLGVWGVSYGLAPFTFSQRVSFNQMTWTEWATSFVYGLPSFGDNLAEKIFPEEIYRRHDFGNPEGFYQYGNRVLRLETLEKAGGKERHMDYLLKNHMFNQPFKHIMVTFSLVWRGMWVGSKLGVIALPSFALFLLIAFIRKRWEYIVLGIPPLFMLGFHAFTSVNITRYNLIMFPALGLAFGWALLWAFRRFRKNRRPLPGLEPEGSLE